jgi:hypothetical protein
VSALSEVHSSQLRASYRELCELFAQQLSYGPRGGNLLPFSDAHSRTDVYAHPHTRPRPSDALQVNKKNRYAAELVPNRALGSAGSLDSLPVSVGPSSVRPIAIPLAGVSPAARHKRESAAPSPQAQRANARSQQRMDQLAKLRTDCDLLNRWVVFDGSFVRVHFWCECALWFVYACVCGLVFVCLFSSSSSSSSVCVRVHGSLFFFV